jgi:hypothetical protein
LPSRLQAAFFLTLFDIAPWFHKSPSGMVRDLYACTVEQVVQVEQRSRVRSFHCSTRPTNEQQHPHLDSPPSVDAV